MIPSLPQREHFEGRVAVVTGGTDGLGLHLACTLTDLGAEVFVCGRDRKKGESAQQAMGPKGRFVPCDLADESQARAFVETAAQPTGRIDYLVNNAAMDPRIEFETATTENFDRLIAVNLRSYFIVAQAALPGLKAGAGKSIVNVCTTNYMLGLAPFTLYNAAKSGIIGFTRSLARELGPLGIRVNTVSPGWIMTEKQLREHVSEKDKADLLDAQAMKFLLAEEHVTPATLFLLSPAATGITGQNLVVDAGKFMQ
ncbi:MAG TPA: SDR family oxidoreductase [Candidatus Hydrogenedentes bacterium]|nr:SDR family oxidoreductase [Candidatus Hydrogenedentota bacterium]